MVVYVHMSGEVDNFNALFCIHYCSYMSYWTEVSEQFLKS